MLKISLSPIPSQVINVTLNNQNCEILVFQKTYGLFVSVTVNRQLLVASRLVRNGVPIMSSPRFNGDLVFVDMQAKDDPFYTRLGSRFKLFYLEVI